MNNRQLCLSTSHYKTVRRENETMRKKTSRYMCSWVLIVSVVVAGCHPSKLKEDPEVTSVTEGLDAIDVVQLEDLSSEPPVSVEEARAAAEAKIEDPNAKPETIELTLADVRAATLANNLNLKIDLIDPSIAQRSVDVERAKFEAAFYSSAVYDTYETDADKSLPTFAYETGIELPLATGGSVSVGMPFGHGDIRGGDSDGVAEAAVSVSYTQSLLKGAGTRVNTHSIRIAQYEKHQVDAYTKQSVINLLANADAAYWRLYAAEQELNVRRNQYGLAQDQLHHAQRKVAAGASPKTEIIRAEAGVAARVEAVINAETAVESQQRELRRIMNRPDLPLNSDVLIVTTTEPDPQGWTIDPEALVKTALANRMETVRLELQLAIDELNVELARNNTLPDLTLHYGYTTRAANSRLGGAFRNFGDESYDSHTLGLYATIPLGNRAAKARLQRQKLQQIQNRAGYNLQRQYIQQEVYEAVSTLEKYWRRILAAEQGVVTAYRDYRLEQSQFQLGRRNSTDVLYSASNLAEAQLSRISAFSQYEIAQIRLAVATGTLLGHDRILIEPIDLTD